MVSSEILFIFAGTLDFGPFWKFQHGYFFHLFICSFIVWLLLHSTSGSTFFLSTSIYFHLLLSSSGRSPQLYFCWVCCVQQPAGGSVPALYSIAATLLNRGNLQENHQHLSSSSALSITFVTMWKETTWDRNGEYVWIHFVWGGCQLFSPSCFITLAEGFAEVFAGSEGNLRKNKEWFYYFLMYFPKTEGLIMCRVRESNIQQCSLKWAARDPTEHDLIYNTWQTQSHCTPSHTRT